MRIRGGLVVGGRKNAVGGAYTPEVSSGRRPKVGAKGIPKPDVSTKYVL